jgi:hypothetical protein
MWSATHIVLATEGEVIDGRLRVIESWKGDFEPDAEIVVPNLARYSGAKSRQVKSWQPAHQTEPYVRVVTGARMLLFLTDTKPKEPLVPVVTWDSGLPASVEGQGDFWVSFAWVEKGEVYARHQLVFPSWPISHFGTALEVEARAAYLTILKRGLEEATLAQSPVLASQVLRASAVQELELGVRGAIEALANMGEDALPVLRALLNDPKLSHLVPRFIQAMYTAGGEGVAPELTALNEELLAFWEARAPERNYTAGPP